MYFNHVHLLLLLFLLDKYYFICNWNTIIHANNNYNIYTIRIIIKIDEKPDKIARCSNSTSAGDLSQIIELCA